MTLLQQFRNGIRSWLRPDESARRGGRLRLECQSLEARENPSGIYYNSTSDTITVIGSENNDHLHVWTSTSGGLFSLPILRLHLTDSGGGSTSYGHSPLSGPVDKIVYYGYGGHDSNAHQVSVPLWAFGGSGNDYLVGGTEGDRLYGEYGNDTLIGMSGGDILNGGDDHDYLYGMADNDYLNGAGGNDYLSGSNGDDQLYGGTGADTLYGGDAADFLDGGSEDDILHGDGGNDRLSGDAGNDQLFGGAGRDALLGWSGSDFLDGGTGYDRFLQTPNVGNEGFNPTVFSTGDVAFNFSNGSQTVVNGNIVNGGSWSIDEVWDADAALATMVERSGDNVLLRRAGGDPIFLYRYGVVYDMFGTVNTSLGGWNSDNGNIGLPNNAFTSEAWLRQVIYHEIGHNWDDEGPVWTAFKQLSGWTTAWAAISHPGQYTLSLDGQWSYRNGSTFARAYGRENPYEDFATVFAKYFVELDGDTYPTDGGSGNVADKLSLIDLMLDAI